MNELRQWMTLCEQVIEESGASRVLQHIHEGVPFIMISAMRASVSKSENMARTRKMSYTLQRLPVSYIHTEGEYWEDGADAPSKELSFFVMAKNPVGSITPNALHNIGVKLIDVFDQDAFIFGDGKNIQLVERDGSQFNIGNNTTFDLTKIAGLPGFSSVKKTKFSFTDEPTKASYGKAA